MSTPTVIQISKDDGSPAYIRVEPRDEETFQLYQTDEAGHLHFTTMGIAPEIGENTPALEDNDNADHLGHFDTHWVYTGDRLSAVEFGRVKHQLIGAL